MVVSTLSSSNRRMSSSRRRSSNNNRSAQAASAVASASARTTSLSDRLVLSLTRRGGGNDSAASNDYNMNDEGSSSTIDGLQSEEFRFISAAVPSHSADTEFEEVSKIQQPERFNQNKLSGSTIKGTSLQHQRRPSRQIIPCLTSYGEEEEGEEMENSDFGSDIGADDMKYSDVMFDDDISDDKSEDTEEDYDYDGYRDDDDFLEKELLSSVLAKIEAAEQFERQQQQQSLPLDGEEKSSVLSSVATVGQQEHHRYQQEGEEDRYHRQKLHEEQQRHLLQQQEAQALTIQQHAQPVNVLINGSGHSDTFATRIAFDGSLVQSPRKPSSAASLMDDSNQSDPSAPCSDNPNERQLQLQLQQLEQLQAQLRELTAQQEQVQQQGLVIATANVDTSESTDTNLRLELPEYRIPSKASLMDESEQDEEASIVQDYRFEQLTRSPSFKARAEALAAASVSVLNCGGGPGGMPTNFQWDNDSMLYSEEVLNNIDVLSEGDEDEFKSTSESSSSSSACSSLMVIDRNEFPKGQDENKEAANVAAASLVLRNFLNNNSDDDLGDIDNGLDNANHDGTINQYQRPLKESAIEEGSMESDDTVSDSDDNNGDFKILSNPESTSNTPELGGLTDVETEKEDKDDLIPSAEWIGIEKCTDRLHGADHASDTKPAAKQQTADKPKASMLIPQVNERSGSTTIGGVDCGLEATASIAILPTEQSSTDHLKKPAVGGGIDKVYAVAGAARAATCRSLSMSFLPPSMSSNNVAVAEATPDVSMPQPQPSPKGSKSQQSSLEPTSIISRKFALPRLARAVSETAVNATVAATRTRSSGIGGVIRGKDLRQRGTSARSSEPAVAPGAVAIRGVDKSDNSEVYDEVYDISGAFSANSSKEFLMDRSNEHGQQRRNSGSANARRSFARKLSGAYNILARDVSVVTAELDIPDYEAVEQERLELRRRVEEMEARVRNSVAAVAVPEQREDGVVTKATPTSLSAAVTSARTCDIGSSGDVMVGNPVRASSHVSSDVENQRSSRTDSIQDGVDAVATMRSNYCSATGDDEASWFGTELSESRTGKKLRKGNRNCMLGTMVIVLVFAIAVAIGATRKKRNAELKASSSAQAPASFDSSSDSDASSTSSPGVGPPLRPTLERVTERGTLICRAEPVEVQQGAGFSIDLVS